MSLEKIFEGFKNLVFKNPKVEKVALDRLKVCHKCPSRKGIKCGKCGCFLATKTRSLTSECPDKRW